MSADKLAALAGVLLSLLLSYFPGLSSWYGTLAGKSKSLVFLGLLLAGTLLSFGVSCANFQIVIFPDVACTRDGLLLAVNSFVAAAIAGAGTYVTTNKLK